MTAPLPPQPGDAPGTARRPVQRLVNGQVETTDDLLAGEEPLEIRIGDQPLAVTMRTPGSTPGTTPGATPGQPSHDEELAAGFCLTEGVIAHPDDLESVTPCSEAEHGNVVVVQLSAEALDRRQAAIARARRELYLSSSCGLCGKQSIDRLEQQCPRLLVEQSITRNVLQLLPQQMAAAQATFHATGGLHAALLATTAGRVLALREDVGRHNAVDKVIGHALLTGQLPLRQHVLLVSGRTSFEIVQKAAVAGITIIASVSAPSSLAVDTAVRLNLTLVGFLRPQRMNVYHDPGRLIV